LRNSAIRCWWNEIVPEKESKPIHDEQTLAKVLEAAYVMQEHNRELQKTGRGPKLTKNLLGAEKWPGTSTGQPQPSLMTFQADSGFSLAQIVEIQHQVQVRHLGLENVMSLVVERLTQIARVGGAAIGILENTTVQYQATAGVLALPAGTEVAMEKALCVACLRSGDVFRCTDVNTEPVLDKDECRRRGIQSMIAIPLFHRGAVAGSLELYFPKAQAFTEEDVHSCQLVAGLVTEALARDAEVSLKKSLASDRAVMLEALEKLKPDLAALADAHAAKGLAAIAGAPTLAKSAQSFVCRKCGHELVGQEQFCGNCGSPRSTDSEAPNLQSKVASLWHMQQAMKKTPQPSPANGVGVHEEAQAKVPEELSASLNQVNVEESVSDFIEARSSEPFAAAETLSDETTESTDLVESGRADFESAAASDLEIPLHTVGEEEDIEEAEPTAL
jgi:putative methionine-R-sulfoxide reductase with GAF domain/ribosomal protein L37E